MGSPPRAAGRSRAPAWRRRAYGSVWILLLPALLLPACDLGLGNPLASFESRCAKLRTTRFDVVTVPMTYTEDRSQSIEELTVRGGFNPSTHSTYGLTTARFSQQSDIELNIVEDAAGGRSCGTGTVRVELSMQPMIVHIASEVERTPCARDATLTHELKHVAVFREVLNEAARDLAADLPEGLGTQMRLAPNRQELERTFTAQLRGYLSAFMSQWQRELTTRQDAVDSPEEYARTAAACRP